MLRLSYFSKNNMYHHNFYRVMITNLFLVTLTLEQICLIRQFVMRYKEKTIKHYSRKINYYRSSKQMQFSIDFQKDLQTLILLTNMMITLISMIHQRSKEFLHGVIESCLKKLINLIEILSIQNIAEEKTIFQIIDLYMDVSK